MSPSDDDDANSRGDTPQALATVRLCPAPPRSPDVATKGPRYVMPIVPAVTLLVHEKDEGVRRNMAGDDSPLANPIDEERRDAVPSAERKIIAEGSTNRIRDKLSSFGIERSSVASKK